MRRCHSSGRAEATRARGAGRGGPFPPPPLHAPRPFFGILLVPAGGQGHVLGAEPPTTSAAQARAGRRGGAWPRAPAPAPAPAPARARAPADPAQSLARAGGSFAWSAAAANGRAWPGMPGSGPGAGPGRALDGGCGRSERDPDRLRLLAGVGPAAGWRRRRRGSGPRECEDCAAPAARSVPGGVPGRPDTMNYLVSARGGAIVGGPVREWLGGAGPSWGPAPSSPARGSRSLRSLPTTVGAAASPGRPGGPGHHERPESSWIRESRWRAARFPTPPHPAPAPVTLGGRVDGPVRCRRTQSSPALGTQGSSAEPVLSHTVHRGGLRGYCPAAPLYQRLQFSLGIWRCTACRDQGSVPLRGFDLAAETLPFGQGMGWFWQPGARWQGVIGRARSPAGGQTRWRRGHPYPSPSGARSRCHTGGQGRRLGVGDRNLCPPSTPQGRI